MSHNKLQALLIKTAGQETGRWYSEQTGMSTSQVAHMKRKLNLVGSARKIIGVPEGATHQHKDTQHFYRVTGDKVFRQAAGNGWALSQVSLADRNPHAVQLLEPIT